MNNSWSSGASPGFMYYSLDETPPKKSETETSDFISFSDFHNPSPQASRFNPSNYSSPQNFRRGSPGNFHTRGWKQRHNTSYSPITSFNSSNNSRHCSRGSSFKSRNNSFNTSAYIHPSFMEDPWANLEKELERKKQNESCEHHQDNDSSDYADTQLKGQQIT